MAENPTNPIAVEPAISRIQLIDGEHELNAKYWDGHTYDELAHAITFIGSASTTVPTSGDYVKANIGGTTYYIQQTTTSIAREVLAEKGSVFIIPSSGQEYLCTTGGTSAASVWTVLGDENTYAAKAIAAKAGTYTTTGSTASTSEAASYNATVTLSNVKYKKADDITSSGAHTHSVTANGAYTPAGSIVIGEDMANYIPEGEVAPITIPEETHQVTVSGLTAANKQGVVASITNWNGGTLTAPSIVVTGVDATAQSLTGTTTFNTDAIKDVSLTSATTTSTGAIKYVEAIASTAASASGTTTVITGYPNFTGGSATGTFVTQAIKNVKLASATATSTGAITYVESVSHTPASVSSTASVVTGYPNFTGGNLTGTTTFNTDAIKSVGGTKNYGFAASTSNVMTAPTVSSTGVLSWTLLSAATQDAHTGTAATSKTVSFTPAALGTAGTTTAVTGINGGGATPVTKYLTGSGEAAPTASVSWTAATLGTANTATVVTGVKGGTVSPTTKYLSKTVTAASTASVGISGLTVTTSTAAVSFTGATCSVTAATVMKSMPTISVAKHDAVTITPTFIGYGVDLQFAGTAATVTVSGTIASSGAHTHAISYTDTVVTGSATAAITAHTHTLNNHTHSVTLSNCA